MSDIIALTPTMELRFLRRYVNIPAYRSEVPDAQVQEIQRILQQKFTVQTRAGDGRGINFTDEWRDVPEAKDQ